MFPYPYIPFQQPVFQQTDFPQTDFQQTEEASVKLSANVTRTQANYLLFIFHQLGITDCKFSEQDEGSVLDDSSGSGVSSGPGQNH